MAVRLPALPVHGQLTSLLHFYFINPLHTAAVLGRLLKACVLFNVNSA